MSYLTLELSIAELRCVLPDLEAAQIADNRRAEGYNPDGTPNTEGGLTIHYRIEKRAAIIKKVKHKLSFWLDGMET